MVELVRALKRGIDEVVESATDVVTRIVRRCGKSSCSNCKSGKTPSTTAICRELCGGGNWSGSRERVR
ncbi:hypothetical protein PE067_01750 [Paracoccus sp. DMF-8]|uniref:hypothetical protein n=1 Tax=Paracoccus sp. DMF-8 TaxID=3019445 RepID=UPI0023E7B2CE|nr:hypothetical protein [Paracoccus sp. DMF-8]MDF3604990.1 hypothetical protein [Paracoccus sp. DMF-8]